MSNYHRRRILLGILALPISAIAALRTPAATEGPFYPTAGMRFADVDNDLVKITDAVAEAGGEVVRLQGRVYDAQRRPIDRARVEIWQCDVNGRYLHRADGPASARDPAFQGFGHDTTDDGGNYSFRTIKPVPYSGRTPHIHVKVWVAGRERLTTQFYLPDHADNQRDWLFRQIPSAERDLVTMRFVAGDKEPVATLDLIV